MHIGGQLNWSFGVIAISSSSVSNVLDLGFIDTGTRAFSVTESVVTI